nr:hypothetical protein [Streptomyces rhizoryzae]
MRADSAPAGQGRANVSDGTGTGNHPGALSGGKRNADAGHADSGSTTTRPGGGPAADSGPRHYLADTGSPDTAPYVVGGAGFLALGAALVSYSVRRTRDETA